MALVISIVAIYTSCLGQTSNVLYPAQPSSLTFIANQGQIKNGNDIAFYSHKGNVKMYCRPGKISFVFSKVTREKVKTKTESPIPNTDDTKINTNRIDLLFVNSNKNAEIIGNDQQAYYENFYLANMPEKGITNVPSYNVVLYKNIYPMIDMKLYCMDNGLKYEFIIHPGGNTKDIKLEWQGLEKLDKHTNGGLIYSFNYGKMDESAPYTYANDEYKTKIESQTKINHKQIGFKIATYDKTKDIIIDPTISWASYFGGNADLIAGKAIANDTLGSVIITGSTDISSTLASSGAYQTSYIDSTDAFIAKFDKNGSEMWSTYYGGSGQDEGTGIASDKSSNIFISGSTSSISGMASQGAFQFKKNGFSKSSSAFIAKFSPNGIRLWGSYFGGNSGELGNGITIDPFGDAIMTGETFSTNGISTNGSYQSKLLGVSDAFIVKFSNSGSLKWCTYFGGNKYESGNAISSDKSGNIFITGGTKSDSGIASKGAFHTIFSGGEDAFVAKFTSLGTFQWSTYFGGNSDDRGYGIANNKRGEVFITGYTFSNSNIASTPAYQTKYGGNEDAYLAKFSTDGKLAWSTYFGGSNFDIGLALTTNAFEEVYVTGVTASNSQIATKDAFQKTLHGIANVFITRFSSNGILSYSTYFGGNGGDYGYGISIDIFNNIYITGFTNSDSGLTTKNAFQSSIGSQADAFLAKFSFKSIHDAGISGIPTAQNIICPGKQPISVMVKNYGSDTLKTVTINWKINGKYQTPHQWSGTILPDSTSLTNIGNYDFGAGENDTLIAWTSKPNGFLDSVPGNDTNSAIIHVRNVHFAGTGQSKISICSGTHIKIGTNGLAGNAYQWSSNPAGFSSTLADPFINPAIATTYILLEKNLKTGCLSLDSSKVSVSIAKAPVADAGKDQAICKGNSTGIGSDPIAGIQYAWVSNPKGFSAVSSKAIVSPDTTTSYLLIVKDIQGCTDLDSVTITVNPLPVVNPGLPMQICSGSMIQLGVPAKTGDTYIWQSRPKGFSSAISNPKDSAIGTKTYILTENITATGCQKTDSVLVTVVPRPVVKIATDSLDAYTRKFTARGANYTSAMYHWDISDSNNATGYSINHRFKRNGHYKVGLSVAVAGYCSVTDSVSVNINPDFSITIFPNPFPVQTVFQYILPNPVHMKIVVYDMLGRDITTLVDQNLAIGEYQTVFNASLLKTRPGMYLIEFLIDNKVITRKIVQESSIWY